MAITVSLTCAIGSADVFAANADNQYMLDTVYVYGARNSQEDDTVPGGYLNQDSSYRYPWAAKSS